MLAKKCLLVGIFTLLSLSLAISAQPLHPTTGEPLMMDCLRGTPDAIDGDLSDWNLEAMTPAVLDTVEQLSSGQDIWTGPEDCSGKFYMMWDDVNIYMAVVVKDDKLVMNKTDGSIWNSDCVEMFFATTDAEAEHSWTNPTIHYQYGFNANNQTWNWCNMDGPGQSVPDYLQVASSVTADGYICEASIEYAQMSALDFSVGNTIGIHPCIDDTDIDDGDTEYQMSWTGLAAHDQSMGYGHMLLSADSVPDMTIGFGTPVIDGEVDYVWANAAAADFVALEDPADGSGTWKVLYDADNLYVLVDVTDDVLQNDSASSWQDDSVEIYFDGGNTKLSTPLSGDDHQYTFGWTADDIQGTNITGYTEGIEQAQVTTDTGWRIEVKMPWMSIWGMVPQAGDLIGIDCYYNDDDDGGDSREGKMLSFSAIEGWNDASQWGTAVLAPQVVPVDPGTDGLLASYPLASDANDTSGNGINGTIYNAETGGLGDGGSVWVDDPERGTVISFNGTASGAYVRAGEIPQMTLTNDFTWSFWAKQKAENTADNDIILGNRMNENAVDFVPRQFIKFTPTKFEWHMNGNGDDNLDYEDIPADVWLHHAVVKTGDQLTYYRNGFEHSSGTFTQPLDFPQPLYFGGDNEGSEGENWNGLMSDVCIYDRALSAGEVRYLAGERAADPSLVIYYSFDEVGDIVADQSGKGHDGAVVGDVTAVAEGILAGAAQLANTGYLDLDGANFPTEDIPTSDLTLAAWTNIDGTSNQNAIFNARASDATWLIHPEIRPGNGDYRFTIRGAGGVKIGDIDGGKTGYKQPEGTPVPNEWVHVAMTYSKADATMTLYVDGQIVLRRGGDGAGDPIENAIDIAGDWALGARVGYNIDDARHYSGLMDEFHMFTRALSQDEILDMMAGM